MLNIIVNGTGAMAQKVSELLQTEKGINFVGFTTEYVENGEIPTLATKLIEESVDAVIDFSHPQQLTALLKTCSENKIPLLLATTGYSDAQLIEIAEAAKQMPTLQTYNTSMGIAAVEHALEVLAKELAGYETEIVEIHHNKKIDAPSGTAIKLKNAVLTGRDVSDVECIFDRTKSQRKTAEEIGMQSLRLGNVYGEHTVYFAKDDEIIELKHTALSKDLFVRGAIQLIVKLVEKDAGLYTMKDFI